jgi:hypothetical protein
LAARGSPIPSSIWKILGDAGGAQQRLLTIASAGGRPYSGSFVNCASTRKNENGIQLSYMCGWSAGVAVDRLRSAAKAVTLSDHPKEKAASLPPLHPPVRRPT